jgi:molecular chaperone GrpE
MSDKTDTSPGNGASKESQPEKSEAEPKPDAPAPQVEKAGAKDPPEKDAKDPAAAAAAPASVVAPSAGAAPAAGAAPSGDPLADAKAEALKNREQWIRTAADFDNFRKRARREIDDSRKAGREELLKDFLPVFDNLERALVSAQRATEVKPVVDGLNMIMKQFGDTLGRSGIQKVPTKGTLFDPTLHEAIQQVESDEAPGTVVAEVQGGYMQGERLVRAALVVVAQPRASAAKDEAKDGATDGANAAKETKEAGTTAGGGGADKPSDTSTGENGENKAEG